MRKIKIKFLFVLLVLAAIAALLILKSKSFKSEKEIIIEVRPARDVIESTIVTTAIILPKNRLEVKPPVNGRIESILVKEGEMVKSGQTIAWMSSTERAALLDAARGKDEEALKYFEEVYKAIPLISPIDAEVIVATTQPGQTVTTTEAVIVLSDQLIVRAQVDETDIGKIKLGQSAYVSLDAYPDTKIKAVVEHIYYESKTINNVTMYEVDLRTENVPEFFRSGMNSSVTFVVERKDNALVIPEEAVFNEGRDNFVLVRDEQGDGLSKRKVTLGVSEGKKREVLSGIDMSDTVVIKSKKYALPGSEEEGTNPFMPQRRQGRQSGSR